MQQAGSINIRQLMWLCAKYERKCQGAHQETDTGFVYPLCLTCKGTGRIPLLEGVREPCDGNEIGYCVAPKFPCVCRGLGWTPTEDAWKWLEAASSLGTVRFSRAGEDNPVRRRCQIGTYVEGRPVFNDAFFAALAAELCTLAVNAAEAEKWVRENIT